MGVSVRHVVLSAVDGTPLEGLLTRPDSARRTALLITHGVAGTYDTAVPGWFGCEAQVHGYATLACNRRDHGPNNYRTTFEDGLEDLRSALDLLSREGFRKVVLCGHSKGTIYLHEYVAETADPRVVAIALFGAVHDNVAVARESYMLGTYQDNLRRALSAVAAGRGSELMQFRARFGPPIALTAEGFLSYYGPLSLARPCEAVKVARVPTLSCYSSSDAYTPERYHLAIVEQARRAGVPVEHVVMRDPDAQRGARDGHCYVGQESETMACVAAWLDRAL